MEPPPPPPPPPKCEALDESCRGEATTKARITDKATFTPPIGWVYAQEAEQTVAVADGEVAALAIMPAEMDDPDVVWATLEKLMTRLEITDVVRKAVNLKKPLGTWAAGDQEVRLWQVEKPPAGAWSWQKQDPNLKGKPGALLITVVPGPEGAGILVGAAFVTRDADATFVDAVKASVESQRFEAPPPAEEAK